MPVLIDIDQHDHHLLATTHSESAAVYASSIPVQCLEIGLINNMPDSALIPTERQLFNLLNAASGRLVVRLRLYKMEATPRSEWGRDYLRRYYRGVDDLLEKSVDGIIVTGAEPRAARLIEEPFWATFAQVVDWARENTVSSIYSCLAVHGAVLHLDGIERQALAAKCMGIFAQTRAENHPLMGDLPPVFKTPHARWNGVAEGALENCGYSVLSRSIEAGVDCFVKRQNRSLFVHFQGHPEYEALSLLGEYRRDMGRFLRGESEICPKMPKGYFNSNAEEILIMFERKAMTNRRPEFFAKFPTNRLAKDVRNVWQSPAKRIFRNWLLYLESQRDERRYSGRKPGSRPTRLASRSTIKR